VWHGICGGVGRRAEDGAVGKDGKGVAMSDSNEHNIERALQLARELLTLADEGDAQRSDVGCGVLFGTVRDCGYKIRALAEAEQDRHHEGRRA